MEIAQIDKTDLSECAGLFVRVFGADPWNEKWKADDACERLQEIYQTPGFVGLSAREGEKIIGFVMGHREQWHDGCQFFLKEFCVEPEQQHSGVGSKLMAELETHLRNAEVQRMFALTARNSPGEGFFGKHGFARSDRMMLVSRVLGAK